MVNDLATVGEDPNQFNEYGEAPLCVAAYKARTNEKLKKLKVKIRSCFLITIN